MMIGYFHDGSLNFITHIKHFWPFKHYACNECEWIVPGTIRD